MAAPIFRGAFSDEEIRAAHLFAGRPSSTPSQWFVAVVDAPCERIVAAIRWFRQSGREDKDSISLVFFEFAMGAGNEVSLSQLLRAFVDCIRSKGSGEFRCRDQISRGSPMEDEFTKAGFSPGPGMHALYCPWQLAAKRAAYGSALVRRHLTALKEARAVPIRHQDSGPAEALIREHGFHMEEGIRAIWNTPDPCALHRDASAYLFSGDQVIAVMLCADAGSRLHVKLIIATSRIPGAIRFAMSAFVDHLCTTIPAGRYEGFSARSERNGIKNAFLRTGGVVEETRRRWFLKGD